MKARRQVGSRQDAPIMTADAKDRTAPAAGYGDEYFLSHASHRMAKAQVRLSTS
jgi:hypothetical protein